MHLPDEQLIIFKKQYIKSLFYVVCFIKKKAHNVSMATQDWNEFNE